MVALSGPARAQDVQDCGLVNDTLPQECTSARISSVYGGEVGPNITDAQQDVGDLGFSIVIGAVPEPKSVSLRTTAAQAQPQDVGRLLDRMGVNVRYNGLGTRPSLAVATEKLEDITSLDTPVTFHSRTNYPLWIKNSFITVEDKTTRTVVARVPINANGTAQWVPEKEGNYIYKLEAISQDGYKDETNYREILVQTAQNHIQTGTNQNLEAVLSQDMTAKRRIPVRGGSVIVTGAPVGTSGALYIMGERIDPTQASSFEIERILPPGTHGVVIQGIDGDTTDSLTQDVIIPNSDWFYTSIVDVTLGKDFSQGHVAGFAEGVTQDGTRITLSIDTQETEIRDLFDSLSGYDPKRKLLEIDPNQPFLTYGDDSELEYLAPTSGKLFIKVEKNNSFAQWGDFKTEALVGPSVSNRDLYGFSGQWNSLETTLSNEVKTEISAYAAYTETKTNQDILQGTNASAYFLSQRNLVENSETVYIEYKDKVSGQIVDRVILTRGQDYRLNSLQGTVFLTTPIPSQIGIRNTQLTPYLVVSYEHDSDALGDNKVVGGRAQNWLTDTLRVGVEASNDSTTFDTTTRLTADLLYKKDEQNFLLLEAGRSKGPGNSVLTSNNSGLTGTSSLPNIQKGQANGERLTAEMTFGRPEAPGQASLFYAQEERGYVGDLGAIESDQKRGRIAIAKTLTSQHSIEGIVSFLDEENGDQNRNSQIAYTYTAQDQTYQKRIGLLQKQENDTASINEHTKIFMDYKRQYDLENSWWIFTEATLQHSGDFSSDTRVGAGLEHTFNNNFGVIGEASYGELGWGTEIGLSKKTEKGHKRLSYVLDPNRRFDTTTLTGKDRGLLVLSGESIINDHVRQTAEIQYNAFGNTPSSTNIFGMTWSPNEVVEHTVEVVYGNEETIERGNIQRTGISYGFKHTTEKETYAIRGEISDSTSEKQTNDNQDYRLYALTANYENKTSEDWRALASLDAAYIESSQSGTQDGTYVKANFGQAYRPVENDKINALFSYTYLNDTPAQGQINNDGDVDGDGQISHILNAYASYDLNQYWTVSGKYGLRQRQLNPYDGAPAIDSLSNLFVARADYHLVHEWDLTGEYRVMGYNMSTTEHSTLVSITKQVSPNARLGVGHAWGRVSDDLTRIKPGKEGFFVNLTASF